VCHLHSSMAHWWRPFFHPTTTHPPPSRSPPHCVKGRGEDGGGEGKQSRAEPCLTPKKGTRAGEDKERRETERQRKNPSELPSREAQKQGEWETGVLQVAQDNVDIQEGGRQTIQKPFSPLLWLRTDKQDYIMLIIETHAASYWDFQCWIYGNSQKVILHEC